jgi:hypothetical protein
MLSKLAAAPNDPSSPPTTVLYYSPLLHCSLLAFATALSDNPLIRQHTTRRKFAERAKQLLEHETGHPCLSLVQALAILSEYHCGIGEREAGYMYMGETTILVLVFAFN